MTRARLRWALLACCLVGLSLVDGFRPFGWLQRGRPAPLRDQQAFFDPQTGKFTVANDENESAYRLTSALSKSTVDLVERVKQKLQEVHTAGGVESIVVIDELALDDSAVVADLERSAPQQQRRFVSTDQLKEVWDRYAAGVLGKSASDFDIAECVRLLHAVHEVETAEEEAAEEMDDTVFVSEEELRRVWERRARENPWGAPGTSFSVADALLLVDTDSEDTSELALATDPDIRASRLSMYQSTAEDPVTDREARGENVFWADWPAEQQQRLRAGAAELLLDVDDNVVDLSLAQARPSTLTPDIRNQEFMGDLMFTNPFTTSTLMSEFKKSSDDDVGILKTLDFLNYMSPLDGPREDFNERAPLRGFLNVSAVVRAEDSLESRLVARGAVPVSFFADRVRIAQQISVNNDLRNQRALTSTHGAELDSGEALTLPSPATSRSRSGRRRVTDVEDSGLMDFVYSADERKELQAFRAVREEEYINLTEDPAFDRAPSRDDDVEEYIRRRIAAYPEFEEYVGVEEWGQWAAFDDEVWDDDVAAQLSAQRVLNLTGLYLRDHTEIMDAVDKSAALRRYAAAFFANATRDPTAPGGLRSDVTFPVLERVPSHLTPERHLGVRYTDELIEMKTKTTLHPEIPALAQLLANDSFTHNEELLATNRVGTVRTQYDWKPREGATHKIEEHTREALQPLLQFIGDAATLQSTQNDIVVFDYHGPVRNIIGMQSYLGALARKCVPNLKEFRLETPRKRDPGG